MGQCFSIVLSDVVTDSDMVKMGEVWFRVTPRGDGSGLTTIKIQTESADLDLPIVRLDGGSIFKTETGTALKELQLSFTGNSNNTFFISTEKECYMRIENAFNIRRLGFGFGTDVFAYKQGDNSPEVTFLLDHDETLRSLKNVTNIYDSSPIEGNIQQLNVLPKLRELMIDWTNVKGDIGLFTTAALTAVYCRGTLLNGDLNVFFKNNKISTFQISTYGTSISYKGTGDKLTEGTIGSIVIGNPLVNSSSLRSLGNFIVALSKCSFKASASITLTGDESSLNTQEKSALSSLRNMATVTFNKAS